MNTYKKNGYLTSEFKIFHLSDKHIPKFDNHYHDFHKMLIFISGNASYIVEGNEYRLQPNDILLISSGEIHRPVLHDDSLYERIIIYISPNLSIKNPDEDINLLSCFNQIQTQSSHLIRLSTNKFNFIKNTIFALVSPSDKKVFANYLYKKIKLVELLILVTRLISEEGTHFIPSEASSSTVVEILQYINKNITGDLSIDNIANALYLNKSYIMHIFKSETDYSIGNYITDKRLFLARKYIKNGESITNACYKSGFKTYNSFYAAYKKRFNSSPKTIKNTLDSEVATID